MQGLALTTEQIIEILSVYATAEQYLEAVAATPGWNVIGAFTMPASASVRVDCLGSVSDASLTLRVRVYDITTGSVGVVSGSTAQTSSTTDAQAFSGTFDLVGGHAYQFQAEVTGGVGDGFFGVVRRATLNGISA
jgi:hypothetical protein